MCWIAEDSVSIGFLKELKYPRNVLWSILGRVESLVQLSALLNYLLAAFHNVDLRELFLIRAFPNIENLRISHWRNWEGQFRQLKSDVFLPYDLRNNTKSARTFPSSKLGWSQMPDTTSWICVDGSLFVLTDTLYTFSGVESKRAIDNAALEWFPWRRLLFGVTYCALKRFFEALKRCFWNVFTRAPNSVCVNKIIKLDIL